MKAQKKILIIKPKRKLFNLDLSELFYYKDLIYFFIKRDFITFYKQTILGPLWYIIQPLANTIIFTVIFGNVAKIPTDGATPFIFYMTGTVIWAYFSVCLTTTSNTFIGNAHLFGKIYFPRLTVPISSVVIGLVQFIIQFVVLILFLIYFISKGYEVNVTYFIIFVPFLLLHVAILSFGVGVLIASLTTKYRDLKFLMSFGIQLWMFATPIVYPLSIIPEKYLWISLINPMSSIVETFRYIVIGTGTFNLNYILFSFLTSVIIFIIGVIIFNKIEKNFMDTV